MLTTESGPSRLVPSLISPSFEDIRPHQPGRREWAVRLFVLFAALAILVPNAGAFGLWDCWETHYGEVARYMNETGDLLSPWWGYKEQIGTEPKTGEWFFSKPVLIMYGEILMIKLIGYGEWAIRLPQVLLAVAAVFLAYVVMARVFSRRVGLMAAGALLTAPLFAMLSRQAITDMPFVGTLTIGLLFFINAYFSPRFTPSRSTFWIWFGLALGFFLVVAVPQFVNIALDLEPDAGYENLDAAMRAWLIFQKTGIFHALIYFLGTGGLLALILVPLIRDTFKGLTPERMDLWMRRFSLWVAFTFLGLATLGKGLLGFMLPGALLGVYLLLTGEWRALKRLEILRGSIILCLTMLPWYLGMFAKHGNAFYTRFLVHDHFNRLGAGVHQIDTGTFDHFIKWLSIGTFPWIAFAPLLIWGLSKLRLRDTDPGSRTRVFLFVWSFFTYLLFTLSATKFHHYIFPALPPFLLLIAIHLDDFLVDKGWIGRVIALAGLGIVLAVGITVRSDVQSFRNMFTYKYDRPLPDHPPTDPDSPVAAGSKKVWKDSTFYEFTNEPIRAGLESDALEYDNFLLFIVIAAAVAFAVMAFPYPVRRFGVGALWLVSACLALWTLNWYMPMLSPSWSQKYLFEDYYKRCTPVANPPEVDEAYTPFLSKVGLGFIPDYFDSVGKRVCREDIVAWLITWRGETYYTASEIKPLMKATQLGPYLETINRGQTFYALTQAGSGSGLKSALDRETERLRKKGASEFTNIKAWDVTRLHDESFFFGLVKAVPITMEEASLKPPPVDDKNDAVPEKEDTPPPSM